ncbi:MAG: hypothetical protein WBB31_05130 [Saprospiraceae bacterium]
MMDQYGNNQYWGMHVGWWLLFFVIFIAIVLVIWMGRNRKGK